MSLYDYKGNVVSADTTQEQTENYKVICIGDSLTEGDYGSEPEGTANLHSENYPYFLNKYFGIDAENAGVCGYTPTSYWNNKLKTLSFSDKDVAVIMLGTNGGLTDTIDADTTASNYESYANTYTGNYCKIIEYIIAQNPNTQIILCSCPYVDPTRRAVYANDVAAANIVVPKIAQKYNLPLFDVFGELGVNAENTAIMQPIDGLHGGIKFYSRIGSYIGSKIMSVLSRSE